MRARSAVLAGLLVLVVLITVAVALRWPPLMTLDNDVEAVVHTYVAARPALLRASLVVTTVGGPTGETVATAVLVLVLLCARRVRIAVYLLAVRAVELALVAVVKSVLARPRPTFPDPLATAAGYSFPSGHSAGTAVLCASVAIVVAAAMRLRTALAAAVNTVAVVVTLAVAASRVLLGVHYLSDVVAGVALGTLCAVAGAPLLAERVRGDRDDAAVGP